MRLARDAACGREERLASLTHMVVSSTRARPSSLQPVEGQRTGIGRILKRG